jgi:hypothetical protein
MSRDPSAPPSFVAPPIVLACFSSCVFHPTDLSTAYLPYLLSPLVAVPLLLVSFPGSWSIKSFQRFTRCKRDETFEVFSGGCLSPALNVRGQSYESIASTSAISVVRFRFASNVDEPSLFDPPPHSYLGSISHLYTSSAPYPSHPSHHEVRI